MNKHILVGVDDTSESRLALHWAVEAAEGRGLAVRVIRAYLDELSRWPALGAEGYVPPPMPLDKFQQELEDAVSTRGTGSGTPVAPGGWRIPLRPMPS
jgi:nucleotide-binding universal stress UspA family protein